MELQKVEVFENEVKVTLMYTNRGERPSEGRLHGESYIVDNLGKRYRYVSNSFGGLRRSFPPQVPEEIWMTFAKVQPGAASVNLVVAWCAGSRLGWCATDGIATVTFRKVPVSPSTSATDSIFSMEPRNVHDGGT